jgi:hypothetical protein
MAIDFGRMARGVATGYLSAKIRNTEANDRLKEDIIRQAGQNFYSTTLPNFQKQEDNRQNTYNKVKARYSVDVAEYMDQEGFITGAPGEFNSITDMLADNGGIKEDQLKAYIEATKGTSFASRKKQRFQSMADQEKFVMGNLTTQGFGVNTIKNQLGIGETKEQPAETMTTAGTQAVAPVPPEEDTTTTKLPSFEEIFGTTSEDRTFKSLDREDQMPIRNRALSEFNALFRDELTGDVRVAPAVKDAYDNLPETQKRSVTLSQFAFDNYFKNTFLPDNNYTFEKTLPADIVDAKQLINQYRAIGDEDTVKVIKQRLIDAGYDIRDYNL